MHPIRKIATTGFAVLLILSLSISALAHSGRTDINGGHTVSKTGEYHYHHGYPAHDHYDMDGDGIKDCPYNSDDKTNHNSGSSNSSATGKTGTTNGAADSKNRSLFGVVVIGIIALLGACAVGKRRSR